MAYHEYTDSKGNLRRQHNNGRRTRQFQPVINIDYGEDNPNSDFWKLLATQTMGKLAEQLGDAYAEWAELVWPGAEIDSFTWREIFEMASKSLSMTLLTGDKSLQWLVEIARAVHAPSIAQDLE